ncbi:MAG: hypothetical protein K2O32_16515 [Acetatifactor sp.]|nr:hypothetical protein [Acetatifactor sp.]
MELKELERLKNCNTETDLVKIVQEIDDRVLFRGYNSEQIFCLVNELIKIDFLSVKYDTREEILNMFCDAISYYGLSKDVNWERVIKIKDKLEDDLKEYVTDFMEPISN